MEQDEEAEQGKLDEEDDDKSDVLSRLASSDAGSVSNEVCVRACVHACVLAGACMRTCVCACVHGYVLAGAQVQMYEKRVRFYLASYSLGNCSDFCRAHSRSLCLKPIPDWPLADPVPVFKHLMSHPVFVQMMQARTSHDGGEASTAAATRMDGSVIETEVDSEDHHGTDVAAPGFCSSYQL